jgi:transaldolase/glucose-6-phosphate isomerase
VNTLPPATLDAFRDHGRVRASLTEDVDGARRVMGDLSAVGISLDEVTGRLLDEGVQLFAEAYDKLIAAIGERVRGGVMA